MAEGRSGSSPGRPAPRLASFSHGILSGDTDEGWTRDAQARYYERCDLLGIACDGRRSTYRASFFPRIEAVRNAFRRDRLASEMVRLREQLATREQVSYADVFEDHFSHSNGAVKTLASLWARYRSWTPLDRIHSLTMVAPACGTREASARVGMLLRVGVLQRAVLVRCLDDRLLSMVSRRRLASWPWGSLGIDGWDLDAVGWVPAGSLVTVDLPGARHSDPLRPGERERTWETIFAPACGLAPWPESFDAVAGAIDEAGGLMTEGGLR